jgi:hypothetical protein
MRFTRLLVIVIFSLLPVEGQSPSQNQGNAILQNAFAAMGCEKLGPEIAITVTGSLNLSDGTAMPVTIYSQGDDRLRSELDTPKGRKTTVINAGRGEMRRDNGKAQKLAEHNTSHQRAMHIPCLVVLRHPSGQIEARFVRTDTGGGDTFDVLEILPSKHSDHKLVVEQLKKTLWVSRTNGYVQKVQYTNMAEQDPNETHLVAIEYSDYHIVDGVAVPFQQITRSADITFTLQLTSVQINAPAANFTLEAAQ